jgi:hypothetical protein
MVTMTNKDKRDPPVTPTATVTQSAAQQPARVDSLHILMEILSPNSYSKFQYSGNPRAGKDSISLSQTRSVQLPVRILHHMA